MTRVPFEYSVVRVVPRVERGESINAGVILYCRERDFLGARTHVDESRLLNLDPYVDLDSVEAALFALERTCASRGDAPANAESIGARFRWLTAPRSTIVQPGPVHTGLTDDPRAELHRLLLVLVLPIG